MKTSNATSEFSLLSADQLPDLMIFIAKVVKKDHILATSTLLHDFQHKMPEEAYYSYLIASNPETGKIQSVLGFIPTYFYDGALKQELQLSTVVWFTDFESNIPGLGILLFRHLLNTFKPSFAFALGISKQAFPMHAALGYQTGFLTHAYMVNQSIDSFGLIQNPERKVLGQDGKRLVALTAENFDAKTEGFAPSADYVPIKTAEYFKRRFLEHPVYSYEVLAVMAGEDVEALIAARFVEVNGNKAIRFVDLTGSPSALEGLGPALQKYINEHGAEYGDLYFFGLEDALLQENGWAIRSPEGTTVVPNYFEPFLDCNVDLNFAFRFQDRGDSRKVLLFKADGDQDRPNQ